MTKNLKRIVALMLAIVMTASFAACKKDKNNDDTTGANEPAALGEVVGDDMLPEDPSNAVVDETEASSGKEDSTAAETEAVADNSAKPSNGKPRELCGNSRGLQRCSQSRKEQQGRL